MAKKNNDLFDQIDSLFKEINADEIAKNVVHSINSASQELNESLKNKGYDNVGDFVAANFSNTKKACPTLGHYNQVSKNYTSAYLYFCDCLDDIYYNLKYRGYFKEGHQQAIHRYRQLADEYQTDLNSLALMIKQEIKEYNKIRKHDPKNALNEGYYQGLVYIRKALKNAKLYMMNLIQKELIH